MATFALHANAVHKHCMHTRSSPALHAHAVHRHCTHTQSAGTARTYSPRALTRWAKAFDELRGKNKITSYEVSSQWWTEQPFTRWAAREEQGNYWRGEQPGRNRTTTHEVSSQGRTWQPLTMWAAREEQDNHSRGEQPRRNRTTTDEVSSQGRTWQPLRRWAAREEQVNHSRGEQPEKNMATTHDISSQGGTGQPFWKITEVICLSVIWQQHLLLRSSWLDFFRDVLEALSIRESWIIL